jgi:uncharacterized protein YihD (DUF1040 family)
MRDPRRIARIAQLLSEVWEKVPDWRLTQLVINASDTKHNCGPVFYLEDDEFEQRLKKLSAAIDSWSTSAPSKPQ